MTTLPSNPAVVFRIAAAACATFVLVAVPASEAPAQGPPRQAGAQVPMDTARMRLLYVSNRPEDHPTANYDAHIRANAVTDSIYRAAAARGDYDYRKITYRSSIGDLDIPAYVYEPRERRGARGHAAIIMVHGGVHGSWTANYLPFVREAIRRGYVVVAPEYRGSTGYGKAFHEEFDYGGYEVEDAMSAYDFMVRTMPHVDPDRVGMMGWSHGGFITALSIFRDEHPFKAGVAIVPVTNLIHRLSRNGPGYTRIFSTGKRIQGAPFEKPDIYWERSPLKHVDKLQVPILVHVATNDNDVRFPEAEQMVNALRAKKPDLAETKVYVDPPGGHSFSRRVTPAFEPDWTKPMRDSWERTWLFLEWNLDPSIDGSRAQPTTNR
ncbi:MAG TPA: alpha/beta fold hydrolase [Gemmatimonadaceae bacterium]|nr:alpha/beta fold hydrolase [Gemmatimonadaceae bacterium]